MNSKSNSSRSSVLDHCQIDLSTTCQRNSNKIILSNSTWWNSIDYRMDARKHVAQLKMRESLQDSCQSSQIPTSKPQSAMSINQLKAMLFGNFLAKRSSIKSSFSASEFKRPRIWNDEGNKSKNLSRSDFSSTVAISVNFACRENCPWDPLSVSEMWKVQGWNYKIGKTMVYIDTT